MSDSKFKELVTFQKSLYFFNCTFYKKFPSLEAISSPIEYFPDKFYRIFKDKETDLIYIIWWNIKLWGFREVSITQATLIKETGKYERRYDFRCRENIEDFKVTKFLSKYFSFEITSKQTTRFYSKFTFKQVLKFILLFPILLINFIGIAFIKIGEFIEDFCEFIASKIQNL